ncbi:MAG: hypothetical protein OEX09_02015 [Candidatus Bathyarchaeota archaeon]|nr:hypothetical protein [Candidatus Bathyarchaeota archaeon]
MVEHTYFVNGIPALYEALKKAGREEEAKELVRNFLSTSFSSDLERKVERLRRLPTGIFPADKPYFRLFWELNQVFISGLYYFTVVAAGVLCERMCHDILDKHSVVPKKNACLHDLIALLSKKHLIKKDSEVEMIEIRKMRNAYVHPREKKKDVEKDALEMIERTARILKNEFQV